MFNIGFSEMILIAIIALVALGPEQLPGVARMFGKLLGEVRRVKDDFTRQLHESTSETVTTFRQTSQAITNPIQSAGEALKSEVQKSFSQTAAADQTQSLKDSVGEISSQLNSDSQPLASESSRTPKS